MGPHAGGEPPHERPLRRASASPAPRPRAGGHRLHRLDRRSREPRRAAPVRRREVRADRARPQPGARARPRGGARELRRARKRPGSRRKLGPEAGRGPRALGALHPRRGAARPLRLTAGGRRRGRVPDLRPCRLRIGRLPRRRRCTDEGRPVTEAMERFDLSGRVAAVTGGAGLLGRKHAAVLASAGAVPVILDIDADAAEEAARELGGKADAIGLDITDQSQVELMRDRILERYGRIDILVNNAAHNPKVEAGRNASWSRLERFPLDRWELDLSVGLTGSFLCSRALGTEMAQRGGGVILNIASDLAVIAPDQRIYREPGLRDEDQPVKPVSYSVVKTGLVGLTRYLATYWADTGVRVNAISPG